MEDFKENKDNADDGSYCVEKTETTSMKFSEIEFSENPINTNLLETASSSKLEHLHSSVLPIQKGIIHYGYRMRLYCRTGYCISILPDKTVRGDVYGENDTGILEFSSAAAGEVRIRGVQSNLYLAMSRSGNLYGEENPRDYATVFIEGVYNQYNTYLSQKYAHKGWYVGIKKNGTAKKASRTKWGQKAIQFLPIRIDN